MPPAHRCRGAQSLRYRLLLSHLSGRTLRVDDIRVNDAAPGLREHEACLLRLLEKVTNGTVVEINETGTRLRYTPGVVVGGDGLEHDCGTARCVTYFLEPLACLALFGKQPLRITLRGVTNCEADPSVDTWRAATAAVLKRAGADGLSLSLLSRGLPGGGGGEVLLTVPFVPKQLATLRLADAGLVKRIRGVAFTERVSPSTANRVVDAVRSVLNKLLPDVYIFTDHRSGKAAGPTPSYGVSLVAETTTGCVLAADGCVSAGGGGGGGSGEAEAPEALGVRVACALLAEVAAAGVVDGGHTPLLFFLAAAGPEAMAKLRVGRLSPAAVRLLRELRDCCGTTFALSADDADGTVVAQCVGLGRANMGRAVT